MDDENAIDAGIGERQVVVSDEGGGIRLLARPVHDALRRRHEGDDAFRPLAQSRQVRRRVADADEAFPGERRPARLELPPDEAAGHEAQAFAIEGAEIDDVEVHARAMLHQAGRRTRPPVLPEGSYPLERAGYPPCPSP